MAFLREGIENVRVVPLADAIGPGGKGVTFSRAALVTWKSCREDRLYQVYVNGRFAGVTVSPQQRQLVIQIPASFEAAVRVEVVAVSTADAHRDFSGEIGDAAICTTRIRLTLLRSQTLPAAATANIYFDNGIGAINYDTPLNPVPISIWSCPQDKAGLGMGQFGLGDCGFDAGAAVGFAKGVFGHGQFGLDADAITWTSPVLPRGAYRFGVKVIDDLGTESPACVSGPITVVPPARPASGLDVLVFDEQTGEVTLSLRD